MNWLLLDNVWADWATDLMPPSTWDAESKSFMVDLQNAEDGVTFEIGTLNSVPDNGVIDFNYTVDYFTYLSGYIGPAYINVIVDKAVAFSQEVSAGSTGRITVNTTGGLDCKIILAQYADDTLPEAFEAIGMSLVPVANAAPVALPWWFCPPKAPVPVCPTRQEGFVPFSEYDPDFTFPTASSRVAAKKVMAEECGGCSPNLVPCEPAVPPPPPPVECNTLLLADLGYESYAVISNAFAMPTWFIWGDTNNFWLKFPNPDGYDQIFLFEWWAAYSRYRSYDGTFPAFAEGEVINASINQLVGEGYDSEAWECAKLLPDTRGGAT